MEEPRNLLRYAIPGWLFLVHLLIFGLVHEAVMGREAWPRVSLGPHVGIGEVAIIVAGLGVPLGYLISQVYFAVYWRDERPLVWLANLLRLPRWPLLPKWVDHRRTLARLAQSHPGLLARLPDRLRRLVGEFLLQEVDQRPGGLPLPWHHPALMPHERPAGGRREAWDVVTFLWYTAADKSELGWAEKKGDMLANVYHSLGATYFALWLAYLAYFLAAKFIFAPYSVAPWTVAALLLPSLCYAQAQRAAEASHGIFTEAGLDHLYRSARWGGSTGG